MLSQNDEYILEAIGIKKNFGGVYALDNVDLRLKNNEILGLVGDNGAGKSTLIKIISGSIKQDEGEIFVNSQKVNINNTRDASKLGIETVYQNLNLIDNQNIPFNIFLGREKTYGGLLKYFELLNYKEMYKESLNLISKLDLELSDIDRPMEEYSGGQRQSVAISKLIYWGTKIAILDEPTAALGVKESRKALEIIKMLKEKSKLSIVIISHNLQQLFSIVDRIMVLRRGKLVAVRDTSQVTTDEVVKFITGSEEEHNDKLNKRV